MPRSLYRPGPDGQRGLNENTEGTPCRASPSECRQRDKSLAEFAPAGANEMRFILGRNSFLPQNTAIAASVEVYDRGAQRRCHPSQLGAQRSGSELKRVDFVDTLRGRPAGRPPFSFCPPAGLRSAPKAGRFFIRRPFPQDRRRRPPDTQPGLRSCRWPPGPPHRNPTRSGTWSCPQRRCSFPKYRCRCRWNTG